MRPKDPQKRDAIKAATFDMVAEVGLSGLKMAQLAKKVGISSSTLYVYFQDKEDLVLTLFGEITDEMIRNVVTGFNLQLDYKENLRGIFHRYLSYRIENYPAVHFYEQMKVSPFFSESAHRTKNDSMQGVMGLVRTGKNLGLLKDIDENLLMAVLGGVTDHITDLVIAGELNWNPETEQQAFDLLWDAIKK